ncbi:hypothetical protein AA984_04265 [Brevibacillus formosus]|uniref:Uncharacterized protein n=1 Tax=Brevibacillus formosus TaxID=54913 RepID=A0A837KVE2_9BACL|nr:hypothetical protein AA984_04265 [Brevibacillus formosus]PSK00186.1 hypothetical protein C7R91_00705 [Brevibacillus formosus]
MTVRILFSYIYIGTCVLIFINFAKTISPKNTKFQGGNVECWLGKRQQEGDEKGEQLLGKFESLMQSQSLHK